MIFNRRDFLASAGSVAALPWFDSLGGFAQSTEMKVSPQRLLMICLPLGIYRDALIPSQEGSDYEATDYLRFLDEFRDQMTVISGLDHPEVNGGHSAEPRIFTGIPSNKKNIRSLDQYVASRIGADTRFDSLVLSSGRNEFSWNDSGTMIPAESKMSRVYAKLFGQEDEAGTEESLRQIAQGKSLLDLVQRQADRLRPKLSVKDQEKLDEYFQSVSETERRLRKSEKWVHTPKPKVHTSEPRDPTDNAEIVTQLRNVCDVTKLAFQTDSTRVVTFGYFEQNKVNVAGVSNAYHALSHHGKDQSNIDQLKRIESEFFKELARLCKSMKDTQESGKTLLDQTTIVVTSNLGNGSNHSNKDLPVLVIGGNYNHGQHLAFEPSSIPLSNLYVTILNQFGLADRSFGLSNGTLPGLEIG